MSETTIGKKTSRKALRWMLGVLALAMCGAVVAYVATRPAPPRKAPAIQARLELAAGDVLLDMGKGEQHAISGTALLANAKLSTGKGARALVRLPDGSTIFMRDGSAVKLGADSVTLDKGEYWLDAPPTDRKAMVHDIGDVTVTAADAGLSVKKAHGATIVYVARGMAIVTSKAGRVEVNAGEQATVKGAAAPKVAALSFWDDWTGGMADYRSGNGIPGAGSGTIYGVDTGAPAGHQASRLEISRQVVKAVVRDGLAETDVDQTFFNPGQRDVEGWYWFTVPSHASVTGFSVETNGVLVKGEFTERHQASTQYTEAKATGHSPAILEWVDSHTYRARIYPVPAGGTRRVVLRYVELRPDNDGTLEYIYPMGSGDPVRIGEFSLSVDLGDAGRNMKIATLADARIEQGGKLVTMRRSGYTPRADFQLEAKLSDKPPPLRLARFKAGGDSADYVLARYTPDVDFSKQKQPRGDVVVVVDTSAAGDEASRQLKASTAEAILRALSDDDRFALVALDVKATVLHPAKGLAPASDQEISKALEALADHSSGGATDLSSLFERLAGQVARHRAAGCGVRGRWHRHFRRHERGAAGRKATSRARDLARAAVYRGRGDGRRHGALGRAGARRRRPDVAGGRGGRDDVDGPTARCRAQGPHHHRSGHRSRRRARRCLHQCQRQGLARLAGDRAGAHPPRPAVEGEGERAARRHAVHEGVRTSRKTRAC